jgi:hypothetical protein
MVTDTDYNKELEELDHLRGIDNNAIPKQVSMMMSGHGRSFMKHMDVYSDMTCGSIMQQAMLWNPARDCVKADTIHIVIKVKEQAYSRIIMSTIYEFDKLTMRGGIKSEEAQVPNKWEANMAILFQWAAVSKAETKARNQLSQQIIHGASLDLISTIITGLDLHLVPWTLVMCRDWGLINIAMRWFLVDAMNLRSETPNWDLLSEFEWFCYVLSA